MTQLPICVDLDGTLIRTDVTQEGTLRYVRGGVARVFQLLKWLTHGRAAYKKSLAAVATLEPALLPVSEACLTLIKARAAEGAELYLVSAADQTYVDAMAAHIPLFQQSVGSDGVRNLRAEEKAAFLRERFPQGFVYAGNSSHDLPVWAAAAEIIVVNAPRSVVARARALGKPITVLDEGMQTSGQYFLSLWDGWRWLAIFLLCGIAVFSCGWAIFGLFFVSAQWVIILGAPLLYLDDDRRAKKDTPLVRGVVSIAQVSRLTAVVFLISVFSLYVSLYCGYTSLNNVMGSS